MTLDRPFRPRLLVAAVVLTQVFLAIESPAQSPRAVPSNYTASTNRSGIKTWQASAPSADPNAVNASALKDGKLITKYF